MKNNPRRRPARRTKAKRVVRKKARPVARLTQAKAARTLAALTTAIAALKSRHGPGQGADARMNRAFALATRLHHLVKGMKSAKLI